MCGLCERNYTTALLKIDGVETVAIELETETISVSGTYERNAIIAQLAHMGYPEKGHNTFLNKQNLTFLVQLVK
jgi:copper chaperone CopZ